MKSSSIGWPLMLALGMLGQEAWGDTAPWGGWEQPPVAGETGKAGYLGRYNPWSPKPRLVAESRSEPSSRQYRPRGTGVTLKHEYPAGRHDGLGFYGIPAYASPPWGWGNLPMVDSYTGAGWGGPWGYGNEWNRWLPGGQWMPWGQW